jgi:hypothetical protein
MRLINGQRCQIKRQLHSIADFAKRYAFNTLHPYEALIPCMIISSARWHELQKSKAQIESALGTAFDQHLRMKEPRFFSPLRLRELAWIKRTEVPALAILDRRRSIWIQDVSLEGDSVGDLLDRVERYCLTPGEA